VNTIFSDCFGATLLFKTIAQNKVFIIVASRESPKLTWNPTLPEPLLEGTGTFFAMEEGKTYDEITDRVIKLCNG
jgi:hypothetical protein